MAAPKTPSSADILRRAGEALIDAAERFDLPSRSIGHRQRLHDEIETAVADARALVRGSNRAPVNAPLFIEVTAEGGARGMW
jgi:hypothetical protein